VVKKFNKIITDDYSDAMREAIYSAIREVNKIKKDITGHFIDFGSQKDAVFEDAVRVLVRCYTDRIQMYGPPPPGWGELRGSTTIHGWQKEPLGGWVPVDIEPEDQPQPGWRRDAEKGWMPPDDSDALAGPGK